MNPSDWDSLIEEVHACRRCPRLVAWREEVALKKRAAYRAWDYWGKPLSGFGDHAARLLVVGLAPAAHGGNRTGRVFTGEQAKAAGLVDAVGYREDVYKAIREAANS